MRHLNHFWKCAILATLPTCFALVGCSIQEGDKPTKMAITPSTPLTFGGYEGLLAGAPLDDVQAVAAGSNIEESQRRSVGGCVGYYQKGDSLVSLSITPQGALWMVQNSGRSATTTLGIGAESTVSEIRDAAANYVITQENEYLLVREDEDSDRYLGFGIRDGKTYTVRAGTANIGNYIDVCGAYVN